MEEVSEGVKTELVRVAASLFLHPAPSFSLFFKKQASGKILFISAYLGF